MTTPTPSSELRTTLLQCRGAASRRPPASSPLPLARQSIVSQIDDSARP